MSILFPCIDNGGTLPNRPITQGYSEEPTENTLRQKMSSGPAKSRRRFTAVSTMINCQLNLTPAQKAVLNTFYKTTTKSGSLEFEWINWDDDTTADYRFTAPPRVVSVEGSQFFIQLSLERLP